MRVIDPKLEEWWKNLPKDQKEELITAFKVLSDNVENVRLNMLKITSTDDLIYELQLRNDGINKIREALEKRLEKEGNN